jgi:hypothetical protein
LDPAFGISFFIIEFAPYRSFRLSIPFHQLSALSGKETPEELQKPNTALRFGAKIGKGVKALQSLFYPKDSDLLRKVIENTQSKSSL